MLGWAGGRANVADGAWAIEPLRGVPDSDADARVHGRTSLHADVALSR